MNSPPRDILIPGSRIEARGAYEKECKECGGGVKMMQTTGERWVGYRWFAYDPIPIERYPHRFYKIHRCPAPAMPTHQQRLV